MAKPKTSERRNRQFTLRVEPDLRAAIETAATVERRPIANLIRNALRDRFCTPNDQPARASA